MTDIYVHFMLVVRHKDLIDLQYKLSEFHPFAYFVLSLDLLINWCFPPLHILTLSYYMSHEILMYPNLIKVMENVLVKRKVFDVCKLLIFSHINNISF